VGDGRVKNQGMEDELAARSRWRIPAARGWNIGLRTAHIVVFSALVGGHVFEVPAARLVPWLWATIVTGVLLSVVEAFPRVCWCYQGRGVCVWLKLILLGLVPWLWASRVPLLFAAIVIASVGAHMPARFRYYSVIHRRVLD